MPGCRLSVRAARIAPGRTVPGARDFALGVALPQLLKYKSFEHWTGGVQGIVIIKPDAPFGSPINADQWLYFFTLAVLLVMFLARHATCCAGASAAR